MIGVPIEGAENVFYDNEYVYSNASFPEYQINKKHQAIRFHQAREFMAANIIIVNKFGTNDKFSDLLTKSLPDWKNVQLRSRIMYSDNPDIYWELS